LWGDLNLGGGFPTLDAFQAVIPLARILATPGYAGWHEKPAPPVIRFPTPLGSLLRLPWRGQEPPLPMFPLGAPHRGGLGRTATLFFPTGRGPLKPQVRGWPIFKIGGEKAQTPFGTLFPAPRVCFRSAEHIEGGESEAPSDCNSLAASPPLFSRGIPFGPEIQGPFNRAGDNNINPEFCPSPSCAQRKPLLFGTPRGGATTPGRLGGPPF